MNPIDMGQPLGITLALLPEVILTGWSLIVLLVVSWRHQTAQDSRLAGWLSLAGLLVTGAALAALWVGQAVPAGLPQMVALDPFRYGASAVVLLAGGCSSESEFTSLNPDVTSDTTLAVDIRPAMK